MRPEEVSLPKADRMKAYNYIMLMSSGNIKIGMTTDPVQRIKQLSNSNGGGFYIKDVCISPQHYIAERVEEMLHWKYRMHRVGGEFFEGLDYDDVTWEFRNIFFTSDYCTANKVRGDFCEEHGMTLSEWKSTHGISSFKKNDDAPMTNGIVSKNSKEKEDGE